MDLYFGGCLGIFWVGYKGHARKEGRTVFRAHQMRCEFLGQREIRLIRKLAAHSLNAATIAGEAGAAIRISPFASLVGTARESSTPRCLARIAIPVLAQTRESGAKTSARTLAALPSWIRTPCSIGPLADSRTSTGQCSVSMGLGVLRLLFVPLRLTGDSEVGEQNCMDDDLAEGRAGELIDHQADALPHRLNSTTPLHPQAD